MTYYIGDLGFPTQAALLHCLFGDNVPKMARYNLWRHLKRDQASTSAFVANTFYGVVVTKL